MLTSNKTQKKKKHLRSSLSYTFLLLYRDTQTERERELKMDKKLIVRSLYRSLCSRSYHVAAVSHTLLRHHHHHLASPSRSLFNLSSPSANRLLSGATLLFFYSQSTSDQSQNPFLTFHQNFFFFSDEIANFIN